MLPNLVIIGAMKCGTVSLHKYLDLHPQIAMSRIDEIDFFVVERNWSKGIKWYESHFPREAVIIGERSTSYTKYPTFSNVPARMHRLIPEAKLIYSVRDPVQRIISHYRHWYRKRYDNRSIEEALADLSNNRYVYPSLYYMQLEQYLAYYPASSIRVITAEDLAQNRTETLRSVFEFLGVDPSFEHEAFSHVHHRSRDMTRPTTLKVYLESAYGVRHIERIFPRLFERPVPPPVLPDSLREALIGVLREDFEKLKQFTGYSFEQWSL